METENNNVQRRRRRPARVERKRSDAEIEYIQPKPFFRKKLIVQLLTVAAVVLAIAVGMSIFFKVDTIYVTGASKYSALTVVEASEIQQGDSLLFFGRAEAANKIKSQLPYVGSVRFEAQLPGTVNIIIEEKTVSYSIEDTNGTWWRVTSDGMVVEKVKKNAGKGSTVTGVLLENPKVGEMAVAAADALEGESVTATQSERLDAAIRILRQMEAVELFENVTNVDVTDLFALRLYCGNDYLIELGNTEDLNRKIPTIKSVLAARDCPDSGVFKLFYEDEQWQVQYNPWA